MTSRSAVPRPSGQRLVPEGRLGIGIQLPVQSQSRLYAEPWELAAGPEHIAMVARAADDAGLTYVGVSDHVAIPADRAERMGTVWYDTIATLGWLAATTRRVRLLSHVRVLPYRHPLDTAKAFCTLDALSGGRAVLGVGAGHLTDEFAVLGADHADRGGYLDEAVDVVRAAFRDEFPEHEGERFAVRDVGVAPRPARPGGPPIWVGGSSPAALRRAAVRGDGWLPQGTPRDELPAAFDTIRRLRREAHGAHMPIDLGATDLLYVGQPTWDVSRWCRTGPPERHAESLRELRELGASTVLVRLRSRDAGELCDQLATLGAEVLPLLDG